MTGFSVPVPLLTALLAGAPARAGDPPDPAGWTEVVWGERIEVAAGPAYRRPWRMNDSRFLYATKRRSGWHLAGRMSEAPELDPETVSLLRRLREQDLYPEERIGLL